MDDQMKQKAIDSLKTHEKDLVELSCRIWELAEPGYQEFESAEAICLALEKEGFEVERGIGGIPTAFLGRYGNGHPVIGILGEYDALKGLSQVSGTAEKEPIPGAECGHGCGHNLLATSCLAGAFIAKHYLEESGKSGTIIYYGCPAEEGGAGKIFMVREGLFQDVDIALSSHPHTANFVRTGTTSSVTSAIYSFKGRQSHPTIAPQNGRSALDALELFHIGINFLREHIPQKNFIHYAVTDAGGAAPNVIPDFAQGIYVTRAPSLAESMELDRRVELCAIGAATMTETVMEKHFLRASNNMITNTTIEKVLYANFEGKLPLSYTEEELDFARRLEATLPEPEKVSDFAATLAEDWGPLLKEYQEANPDMPFNNFLLPHRTNEVVCGGGTDLGDVSWVCPTASIMFAFAPKKFQAHCWQWTAIGKTSAAQKSMLMAGRVLGGAAIDFICDPNLVEEASKEHKKRLAGRPYVFPLPPEARPEP